MTGMLMRCMDGELHHARGIKPDITIPVYATDYMNGYDRILNVALKNGRMKRIKIYGRNLNC